MPDAWVVWPTCNPVRHKGKLNAWRSQGYRVGVLVNGVLGYDHADLMIWESEYRGYWQSVNMLCHALIERADVIVVAADDMCPDPNLTAQEIAQQFLEHFPGGYGVMQPTGDDLDGTDRICGSPWLGREWIKESYCGYGPYWGGYLRFYGDEELFNVAKQQGVLWQRPDLTQYHDHWLRTGTKTDYQIANEAWWDQDKELFRQRRCDGFPGSERL